MSTVVSGDHGATLSMGLLSPCLVLSRLVWEGREWGQHSSVPPWGDSREGRVSSWAVKLFGSSETTQGTVIAGWKV